MHICVCAMCSALWPLCMRTRLDRTEIGDVTRTQSLRTQCVVCVYMCAGLV